MMPDRPSESFDVFLSHPHTEADAVELLAGKLEDDAGMKVWLDRWILIPGEHWQQEMAKGLDEAKTCAVCIGASTPSGWFKEEIERSAESTNARQEFQSHSCNSPEW